MIFIDSMFMSGFGLNNKIEQLKKDIDSIKNTTHVSDNTTLTSGTAVEKKIYYLI